MTMLKPTVWNTLSKAQQGLLLERPTQKEASDINQQVQHIIQSVRKNGDAALYDLTLKFDKATLKTLKVSKQEFDAALRLVPASHIKAFQNVIQNLTLFHQKQIIANYKVETSPGIVCENITCPIQRVGLYIPSGSAPLVSTVLMLGVPSQLAQCPVRVLCSPPDSRGNIDPNILVAARLCSIDTVFKVGGAQAIAAMAYSTKTIPKVDKIFGPGNSWVTTAKMLVALDPKGASLDMPAGPSEVLVIADNDANPAFVAADLLSQAEHGADSQVILICLSTQFAEKVIEHLNHQLIGLSRAETARAALQNSLFLVVYTLTEAIEILNQYAPEHLILQVSEARQYLPKIYAAGSIFLGAWSPESVGDYASGTNHVLPTCGFAKSYSGLSVRDFMKTLTVQELTKEGLSSVAETIRVLTNIEGLDAHQQAVNIRLQEQP